MRDIAGFEGRYQISKNGEVWCYPNRQTGYRWKKKATYISKNGYERVNLYFGGKAYGYSVHRLVACAYIPNPQGKKYVNHKDGNKRRNHADNLEWATAKENDQHAQRLGLRPQYTEKQRQARSATGHKTCRQNAKHLRKISFNEAECIRRIKEHCKVSYRKLGKLYKMSDKTIAAICQYKIYREA